MARIVPAFMILVSASLAHAGTPAVLSPDGKFSAEIVEAEADNPFASVRIVSKENGKTVWESPEESRSSFTADSKCLWSPDSQKFALNCRAGGRYETTEVFRWDGKTFVPLPSIEELFTPRLEAAKEKQLGELARELPDFPDKMATLRRNQRRIWDNFTVRRWIDGNTLEATGYSVRLVTPGLEENDGEDIHGALRLVLRSDARGRWKIIEEKSIPLEDAQAAQP